MPQNFRHTAPEPARLDTFLAEATGESRSFVRSQIELGRVRVNGTEVRKPSHRLKAGDEIEGGFVEPPPPEAEPVAGELDVLHEDEHLIVLNKRQGVVVHPGAGTRGPTLVHHLLHHFLHDEGYRTLSQVRPGIVHRLDRGTSGVILVAKHRHAQEELARQFKEREVKKEYLALTWGVPPEKGTWDLPLGRDRKDRKKMSSRTDKARSARTRWEREREFRHFACVRLFPHTGRTHQLRVHLSEAGYPIVGDPLYMKGSVTKRTALLPAPLAEEIRGASDTYLHARVLTFTHPHTGETLRMEAPVPAAFDRLLALLEQYDL